MKVVVNNIADPKKENRDQPNLLKDSKEAYQRDAKYWEAQGITEQDFKKLYYKHYDEMFGCLYK